MGQVIAFPGSGLIGFHAQSELTSAKEIHKRFGLPRTWLQRWSDRGLLAPVLKDGELYFPFPDVLKLRRLKLERPGAATLQILEQALQGQLDLWASPARIQPIQQSPFYLALVAFDQRLPEARSLLEKAVAEEDFPADALVNLGILDYEAEDFAAAFDSFTRALALDPRHPEAQFNLGNLYFYKQELALSALHYELAQKLAPDFLDVAFNLGLVLALQGQYARAWQELKRYQEGGGASDTLPELLSALESARAGGNGANGSSRQ